MQTKGGFNYIAIALVGVVLVFSGLATFWAWNTYGPALGLDTTDEITNPGVKTPYSGNINWRVSDVDYVAGGTFAVANAVVYYSDSEPDDMGSLSVVTIAGTVIPLPVANKGYAWLVFHNGDSEYAIAPWLESSFLNGNSRIKEITYKDLNGDDMNEMICKVWCGDIPISQSTDPVVQVTFPWVDMDSTVTEDSPADQTSLGTTAGTAFSITWVFSGLTAGDGIVFTKIYVTTNGTIVGDDIRLESLNFQGDGWVVKGAKTSWSKPTDETDGTTYIAYYLDPDNTDDPLQGILAYRPTDKTDRATMTLTGKLYQEAENSCLVTLCYKTITGAGVITDSTDPVILNAS